MSVIGSMGKVFKVISEFEVKDFQLFDDFFNKYKALRVVFDRPLPPEIKEYVEIQEIQAAWKALDSQSARILELFEKLGSKK